jgi:hypothetical protein
VDDGNPLFFSRAPGVFNSRSHDPENAHDRGCPLELTS